uniref:Transposase Tc1-like domain-containing protein n=1 Tax=Amphilophus citrinellus TaxID=61819 RepID=A0A3Q0R331_AMPCI
MGKSRDLSEFERGAIVGARNAGCSLSQTAKLLGCSRTAVSRVYREWWHKQKTSSDRGASGRKRLVDEDGEKRLERMVEANSDATIEEIHAMYNSSGVEKPISLRTARRTLKRLGYSRSNRVTAAGMEALAEEASGPEQLDTSSDLHFRVTSCPWLRRL